MAELTDDGLVSLTVSQIKAQIEEEQSATISPALDLSSTSLLGQVNAIFSDRLASLEEALLALYNAMDPLNAGGDALDRLSALTGTFRRAATATSLSCSLGFSNTGTYNSGTLRANPVGSPDIIFSNVSDIVVSSVPFTASNVLMRAVDTGPNTVILGNTGSGALTEIASPVAGWDFIFGSSSLSIGTAAETDTALRLRRVTELFNPGTGTVNALQSDLSNQVSGVLSVTVLENTASFTVDSIPPYGIEAVVYGPSAADADIADVIFNGKSAGAPTAGNTLYQIADSVGNLHDIYFTRPVETPVAITVTLDYLPGSTFTGVDTVRSAIITNASASWVPGLDVIQSQISAWVQEVPGVLEVDTVLIDGVDARKTINNRQVAAITSSLDITVTPTLGSP